ncbi:hypothetical protein [Actinomadura parmotrematis]|uniref:Uncharacterized protein n=1 Tax=Actinomadura parmotrematis TaxID=2864039 RepID=A0ABS7G5Y1_9ACTN|nr:hypothetical protein [Actinomadura parmotrematis]MBW8487635.1 hypothetical protein [Actinomadura parmotrematis]
MEFFDVPLWRAVVVHDLRYSRAGRPRPEAVRREVRVYSWARFAVRDRGVREAARVYERRERRRLREAVGDARAFVNAGGEAADVDIAPVRHRRRAVGEG